MAHAVMSVKTQDLKDGDRLFGTSGIRGIVGKELTVDLCHDIGRSLGTKLAAQSRICLATDSRQSRDSIKEAVTSGLLSTGVNVVDMGMLPTPALALATREMGFTTGIMLTASHNPPEYNGIKLFNENATGYSRAQELEIEKLYFASEFRQGKGTLERVHNVKEIYASLIRDKVSPSTINRNLRLVVDPANGAASGFASYIFSQMGLAVLPVNDEPDGSFPGRNPEPSEETLRGTVEFLRQHDADLAICFDGDADRVVFCDKEGFLGFNEMIAFLSRVMVKKTGKKRVATTVETGKFLDLALEGLDVELIRGKVGDVNVAYLTQEFDAALGVEGVGVYIFPELGYYPDSIFATLTLLSHLSYLGQLREFFQSLPSLSFKKAKVFCSNELKETVMTLLKGNMHFPKSAEINIVDGLRVEFPDSWVLIRPSGTEPVIRVIAEATSGARADELIGEITELAQNFVSIDK